MKARESDRKGKWLILKGLRPSSLPQDEIDAFVKLYVKAARKPQTPDDAA